MTRRLAAAPLLIALLACATVAEEPGVAYRFDLSLDPASGVLRGQGTLRYRNDTTLPMVEIPLVLYATRFRRQDSGITDQNFDRYYVRWFDAGDMVLSSARVGGKRLRVRSDSRKDLPLGCLEWLQLPVPLAPGAWVEVDLTYATGSPVGRPAPAQSWIWPVLHTRRSRARPPAAWECRRRSPPLLAWLRTAQRS